MLSFLQRFVENRSHPGSAEAAGLYAQLVELARNPLFYTRFQVRDSLDGRFDMITILAVLLIRRLQQDGEPGKQLGQEIVDVMFAELDLGLHEIGVNENKVGGKVKQMATAFLGRMKVYVAALDGGDDARLADALMRNLYRGSGDAELCSRLVAVLHVLEDWLAGIDDNLIRSGKLPSSEELFIEIAEY